MSSISLTADTFEHTVTREGITLVDWWASRNQAVQYLMLHALIPSAGAWHGVTWLACRDSASMPSMLKPRRWLHLRQYRPYRKDTASKLASYGHTASSGIVR